MPSNNSKYYVKSLKTNKVESQKITELFKRKTTNGEGEEPLSKKRLSDNPPCCSSTLEES